MAAVDADAMVERAEKILATKRPLTEIELADAEEDLRQLDATEGNGASATMLRRIYTAIHRRVGPPSDLIVPLTGHDLLRRREQMGGQEPPAWVVPADFDHWLAVNSYYPREFVPLSLGLDPRPAGKGEPDLNAIVAALEWMGLLNVRHIHTRLRIVERRLGTDKIPLRDLLALASSEKWELPERLKETACALEDAAREPDEAAREPDLKSATPPSTKEKTTFLVILAGALRMAKVQVPIEENLAATAKAIVDEVYALGSKIGQRTVEQYLKKIPGALDRKAY